MYSICINVDTYLHVYSTYYLLHYAGVVGRNQHSVWKVLIFKEKEMGEQEEEFPAQWALDLLRGPTIYKEKFYNKYPTEIGATFIGGTSMIFANYFMRRPWYSSIHWHITGTVVGFAVGRIIAKLFDYRYAKRDAIMVDYIKRHPERFPAPRNKKIAEIIEPWYPIR